MVKITIVDCGIAESCRKCLSVCPAGALVKVPVGKNRSSSEKPEYAIKPYYQKLCVGCMACVQVCPKKAIRIKA